MVSCTSFMRPFLTSVTLYPVCLWWIVNILINKFYTWYYAKGQNFADQVSSDNCLFIFCFKTIFMTHSLTEEYRGCSNLHARGTELPTTVTSCCDLRTQSCPRVFLLLPFTLDNLQGPLMMELKSTLKILLGGRGGVNACFSNTVPKLWEYLPSPGLLRSEYW